MTTLAGPADRTLLPFRHLRWRSTVVAMIAAAAPVCATTVWLALQGGDLVPALALIGLLLVSAAVLTVRIARSKVVLTEDGASMWTPRCGRTVSRDEVARAVIRAVHSADGRGIVRHLFLLDAAERTVLRICDRWWTEAQIGDVARHFEVPVETLPEPVHLIELRRSVPGQLRWNEQHPWLARLAIVAGGAVGCLIVGWLAVTAL